MAEQFGCCSSHMECTAHGICMHEGDELYDGCQLKKRLYREKNKKDQPIKKELYLIAFNQLYKVNIKDKRQWFSYELTQENLEHVKAVFDEYGIPYKTEITSMNSETEKPENGAIPCNSRVTFKIGENEYIVYNHGCRLINESYANRIAQAMKNKGMIARSELIGYSREPGIYKLIPSVDPLPEREPEPTPVLKDEKSKLPDKGLYKQVTIFELILASNM